MSKQRVGSELYVLLKNAPSLAEEPKVRSTRIMSFCSEKGRIISKVSRRKIPSNLKMSWCLLVCHATVCLIWCSRLPFDGSRLQSPSPRSPVYVPRFGSDSDPNLEIPSANSGQFIRTCGWSFQHHSRVHLITQFTVRFWPRSGNIFRNYTPKPHPEWSIYIRTFRYTVCAAIDSNCLSV